MTVSYFANNSLRHDAEIHKYFIEVISAVLLVEYFKKVFSQLYVTIRVHLFGHIKYKKKFVNLFADRIIRETSKYFCFYRTVLFYQIMVEFLLLDFLILGHVRKAWVTSIVFHKTMNFEMPFRHNFLCYGRSGSHWEIFCINYELLRWVFVES